MKALAAALITLSLVGSAPLCAQTEQRKPDTSVGAPEQKRPAAHFAAANARVFEIRTYTTSQKMDVFMAFFTENTMKLFRKYGFEPIGFWLPQDPARSGNTFVYMLAFPDRETAKIKWDAFLKDPEWVKARADFMNKHGRVTDKIESQFVSPVDFSPLK